MTEKRENKQKITINIRNNSIFETMKTGLRILYFLLFYNFWKIKV